MSFGVTRHCLEVVSSLEARSGGVSATLPHLARAVAAAGRYRTSILVAHSPGHPAAVQGFDGVPVLGHAVLWNDCWRQGPACQWVREQLAGAELVHIHGLWEPHGVLAARWARRLGKPYLVSAHGMLDRWALRHKRWKKALYFRLLECRNLQGAACLHALTVSEGKDYRQCGLSRPVVVVPHGITVPEGLSPAGFVERFPELEGRRLILFLGRIHAKKGVDILCRAWARVSKGFSEAHLVLAGPDFEGTQRPVETLVEELGISQRVTFAGMLEGELKWSALAAAEVFVLPSHSEGLPVALLEALSAGKPVIATRQCNVPEVSLRQCGLLIEPEAGQVEEALHRILSLPPAEAQRMGQNGRRLAAERYAWAAVGRQWAEVYDWVLGGPRPAAAML